MACKGASWLPSRDIPSLQGKVILITGGSNGLGRRSALDLAKHNHSEIWIADRSAPNAQAVINAIESTYPAVSVKFPKLDLTSFDSIRNAATTFLAAASRLDILILNAGVMNVPAGSVTQERHEMHFGTNHVGHALLVKLLVPILRTTATESNVGGGKADVRVVFVSSVAHKYPPSGGLQFDSFCPNGQTKPLSANALYGQSKLANLLYAREMAKRYPQWTTVSIHPGTVKTDLQKSTEGSLLIRAFRKVVVPLIGVDVEEGARSQLWAATADGVENGEYYEPVGVAGNGSALAKDNNLALKLWDWTQREIEKVYIWH
ncbi:hypothetical protein BDP81DRAFT_325921 [Colletotrichum phormii]|uniref:Oxidoreductase n=1 Tax=Colletotrichum phormii TaxID=359342 RepID=A0AAI9ZNV8_9PEZI|nr:uncharacterized protein BDP81DRAFT_325921 [Colletotrichum phormii]KAK1634064.1 hypothetical protein BDP81DRAFT_325921 [Colletotrichum phormii]